MIFLLKLQSILKFYQVGIFEELDIIKIYLLLIFGIFFLVQIFFYLFFYFRIVFFRSVEKNYDEEIYRPVSVIVCARNEEENLEMHLPTILTQDYPDYEVIVVNDCSTDDSEFVLQRLQKIYPNLKVTTIHKDPKFSHGKKLALTVGIKSAKNELVLLIDADCYVESKSWIYEMQRKFDENTDIILGYGGYSRRMGMLNKLIRFDAFFIAIQYISFAIAKIPYMGVGRNLIYKKSIFFENKGFASHLKLNSGDDDLFINEVANKNNVKVQISRDSQTRSKPLKKYSYWFLQKKRHFTTSKYYKPFHKFLLSLETLSRFFYYIFFALIIGVYGIYSGYSQLIIMLFAFRFLLQIIVFATARKKLNEKNIFIYCFIFDIIMPFINLIIYLSNDKKSRKWR